MTLKKFVVRRTVQLFDVQEFIVDRAADEYDAQQQALALIGASSPGKSAVVKGVVQSICEVVDAGESADWCIRLSV